MINSAYRNYTYYLSNFFCKSNYSKIKSLFLKKKYKREHSMLWKFPLKWGVEVKNLAR